MSDKYLIGVDLGTSATKAAFYQPDGTLVVEASAEVPTYSPKPGVVEQENDDFYRTDAQTVRQCLGASGVDPRAVVAIGFDSQMAGIGSMDEDFKPATRFDSWLEMRCQPYIEQVGKTHGPLVTRLSGYPPTYEHGPKMLWWKYEQPQDYRRMAKLRRVEYDTFYRAKYQPDQNLWPLLGQMVSGGWAGLVALATDMGDPRLWSRLGGGPGLTAFLTQIKSRLHRIGMDETTVRALLGGNMALRLAHPLQAKS